MAKGGDTEGTVKKITRFGKELAGDIYMKRVLPAVPSCLELP